MQAACSLADGCFAACGLQRGSAGHQPLKQSPRKNQRRSITHLATWDSATARAATGGASCPSSAPARRWPPSLLTRNGALPETFLQGSARDMAVKARAASRALQALSSADRVAILNRIADSLEAHEAQIMAENALDVEAAQGKVNEALLQRLVLKPNKIAQLAGATGAGSARDDRRAAKHTCGSGSHSAMPVPGCLSLNRGGTWSGAMACAQFACGPPGLPSSQPLIAHFPLRTPNCPVRSTPPPSCRRHPRHCKAGGAGGAADQPPGGGRGAGAR